MQGSARARLQAAFGTAEDDGAREPFGFYQALQDETRKSLPGWVNPTTRRPYWVAADGAPPLGQDATYGAQGHYGPGDYLVAVRVTDGDGNETPEGVNSDDLPDNDTEARLTVR